ncbi:MAG: hypothetical protein LQ346_007838 [Caloplaca aetnensis]|nr:MAG: hypothetical protein LQ346_007838 [Caloplaca aetnensis]
MSPSDADRLHRRLGDGLAQLYEYTSAEKTGCPRAGGPANSAGCGQRLGNCGGRNGRNNIRGRGNFNIGLQGRAERRAPRPPGEAPQVPALNRAGRAQNLPRIRAAPENARPRRDRQTQPDIVDGWATDWVSINYYGRST